MSAHGIQERVRLGLAPAPHLSVVPSGSDRATSPARDTPEERRPVPAPQRQGGSEALAAQLHAVPDPYEQATAFLVESYERTIEILEAERDFWQARAEKAEGRS